MLSTSSTKKKRLDMTEKNIDWDVKHHLKQTINP